jgi:hypothetical protein
MKRTRTQLWIARVIALTLTAATVIPLLTGCGKKGISQPTGYKTPKDFTPASITDESKLPDDTYFIRHKTKGGYVYYPLLGAENTFADQARDQAAGFDPARIVWVNYNKDEGLVPTMHKGDDLIYKSETEIPTKYALEKFFDAGYTVGVAGLKKDTSGNYAYVSAKENSGSGHVLSTSDAAGFDGLDAKSIYFNKIGGKRVTEANVSTSGTITGLKLMKAYPADIRTGTTRINATLTCNVHLFTSAETYLFGEFTFLTPTTAKLGFPSYAKSGYYTIGGKGFFRYIDSDTKSNKLSKADANGTIYTYRQEDQSLVGTTVGLTWDSETGFLVKETLSDESNVDGEKGVTYDELLAEGKKALTKSGDVSSDEDSSDSSSSDASSGDESITKKTKLKQNDDGFYIGTYTVDGMEDPVTSDNTSVYKLTASNDTDGQLNFVYYRSTNDPDITVGKTYEFIFQVDPNGYDGYSIASVEEQGADD